MANVFLILRGDINKLYSTIIGFIIVNRKFLSPNYLTCNDNEINLILKRQFKSQEGTNVNFFTEHKTYPSGTYILRLVFFCPERRNF